MTETRPRARSESRQRPKLVGVRLTEEEFVWLEARAKQAGVKVPTLIRRAALFYFNTRDLGESSYRRSEK